MHTLSRHRHSNCAMPVAKAGVKAASIAKLLEINKLCRIIANAAYFTNPSVSWHDFHTAKHKISLAWRVLSSYHFSCDQAVIWMVQSVCPSVCLPVCLLHLFHYVYIVVSSWHFQELWSMTEVMRKVKVTGQRSRSQRSNLSLGVSGLQLQFEFTNGFETMHNAWRSIEDVPICFTRPCMNFQGPTGQKITIHFKPESRVSGL